MTVCDPLLPVLYVIVIVKLDFRYIYTPTKVKQHPIVLSIHFVYINTVKTIKYISPFFLHFLKDYTNGSKNTNLRSIYHPERRDYDVAKIGFKTGAGKA